MVLGGSPGKSRLLSLFDAILCFERIEEVSIGHVALVTGYFLVGHFEQILVLIQFVFGPALFNKVRLGPLPVLVPVDSAVEVEVHGYPVFSGLLLFTQVG